MKDAQERHRQNQPINFSTKFLKHLDKSPEKVKVAFEKRLALWAADPRHALLRDHKLRGRYKGYRSINITGDWRAVYIKKKGGILFTDLGTHSQLYKE